MKSCHRLAGLLVPALLLLSGCADRASAEDIVTLALDVPPTNLDPRIGIDATSERLAQLLFNALVRRDGTSNLVPDLAESWEIPDSTTYIFHLRDDVRFHDGRPLEAKDVVYTFRSILDGSLQTPKASAYRKVASVEALDEGTVQFRLSEPFAPFLWNLARGAIGIVPEGAGSEMAEHPIGSGPFVFDHYFRDAEILLRANPDYFGERPRLSAVRFKIVPEAIIRALELRKGTVDIALNVLPADMAEELRESPGLRLMDSEGTNYQYLAFNLLDPAFRDVRVRRAIAHAVDRTAIIESLWRNHARLADSILPPNNWAYFDGVTRYTYDPDRARAILDEAGISGLGFTYSTSTDETGLLVASVIQQQLREVGIDMEIRSNEFATFFADVQDGNFQMYSLRWIGGNNDPDILNYVFHSGMTPVDGGGNRGSYVNSDVDGWLDTAQSVIDVETRIENYARIQKAVSDDLPYISLWYVNNVCVYNERIQGMQLYPAGDYEFLNHIWVEED